MEHQPAHRGSHPGATLTDTIVAAATPAGRGGVAMVRVSGPGTPQLARELLGLLPSARHATRAQFRAADGSALDHGLALYFPAPHSYTGEAVLELHGHGGPVLVEALIRRVLQLGARRAGPGEFTQRAYLNGKLDLAQAEAVADLINAASEAAARAALRSLEGEFSRRVRALAQTLAELRALVEAGIDFADEQIDVLSDRSLQARLEAATTELTALRDAGRQGRLLAEGMSVVIAGRPNAGKSSVLNRLAGHDAAIVTALPGTTRDLLRERIVLDGMPLQVLDTAGLRRATDAIEVEGIRRARAAISSADRIVFVIDAAADPHARGYLDERAQLPSGVPVTVLFNKIDLLPTGTVPSVAAEQAAGSIAPTALSVSALSGAGFDALASHLKASMGFEPDGAGALSARARHLDALTEVQLHLGSAADQLSARNAPELVAEELKRAQQALGEIVGPQTSEQLLAQIFSRFCIGK
ncbi:MAG TPA: tRNA uridine-5-carboxymethylaminomethyl(34) synthesis GTPase MnmE [Steroidobacteraceae bacterium]